MDVIGFTSLYLQSAHYDPERPSVNYEHWIGRCACWITAVVIDQGKEVLARTFPYEDAQRRAPELLEEIGWHVGAPCLLCPSCTIAIVERHTK